jgi:NitT/TauT family transport system substrate-binding protein
MQEEILLQAIDKIKKYNLISNFPDYSDIGSMTNERWKEFFTIMSNNNIYKKDLKWEDSFTIDFVNNNK